LSFSKIQKMLAVCTGFFQRMTAAEKIRYIKSGAASPNSHQTPRICIRQRSEDHRIHHAEHGGVYSDPQSKGKNYNGCKTGSMNECPDCTPNILPEAFHNFPSLLLYS